MRSWMIILSLAVLTTTGCDADLSGTWDIEVEDDAGDEMDGTMVLYQDGVLVHGIIELDFYSGCPDLEGEVEGWITDGQQLMFDIEWDDWTCDGDTYSVYDMEIDAVLTTQGQEVVNLRGDGEWGSGDVDFVADRW